MKSKGTPIKYVLEETSRRKDMSRSPGRSMISVRKEPIEFNPGLYITSRFNQQDIIAIKEAFDAYDTNKTGLLTPNDLKVALFHNGFHATKETVYSIIAEYDQECLGGIDFASFIKIIEGQPTQKQSENEIKKVFRKLDRDNKGYLDRKDLQNMLRGLGDQWQEADLQFILEKIDQKEGSRINYETFKKIMHSPLSIY